MLDDAGWKKGSDGIRAKDGKRLSFSMYAHERRQGRRGVHGRLPAELAGYRRRDEAAVARSSASSSPGSRKTFDFETFLVGFSWGVDPDQQTMWDSKQHGPGFNLYDYKNPKVDQLLEQAACIRSIRRSASRSTSTCRISSLADAPAMITDFPKTHRGVNKRVKNLVPNAVDTIRRHQCLPVVCDGREVRNLTPCPLSFADKQRRGGDVGALRCALLDVIGACGRG